MPAKEPEKRQSEYHAEFGKDAFADNYPAIADTFIDTKGAAKSFGQLVPRTAKIFEVGLGSGYFGQFLHDDGYQVMGIEPVEKMLLRLKANHPDLKIAAETDIQQYEFDDIYDAIISHSSIFLFTRPSADDAQRFGTDLIFQSFIDNEEVTDDSFDKVMRALTPDGALYINIQPNAQATARVNDTLTFEMYECEYDFDNYRARKVFGLTENGIPDVWEPDICYVQKWDEFQASMSERGYEAEVSDDGYWVLVRNKAENGTVDLQRARRTDAETSDK